MKNMPLLGRFSAGLLIIFALFLTGCASTLPQKTTPVAHYPDCYDHIQKLRDTEHIRKQYFWTRTKEGTSKGIADTMGWVRDRLKDKDLPGADLADSTTTYFHGVSEEQTAMRHHLDQHISDIEKYSGRMEQTIDAVRQAQRCYSQRFDNAVADYKAQRITREVFDRQYAEISAGMAEASGILQKAVASAKEVQENYQEVMVAEAKQIGLDEKYIATLKNPPQSNDQKAARQPAKPKPPKNVDKEDLRQMEKMAERGETLALTLALMEDELAIHGQRLAAMSETKENI